VPRGRESAVGELLLYKSSVMLSGRVWRVDEQVLKPGNGHIDEQALKPGNGYSGQRASIVRFCEPNLVDFFDIHCSPDDEVGI